MISSISDVALALAEATSDDLGSVNAFLEARRPDLLRHVLFAPQGLRMAVASPAQQAILCYRQLVSACRSPARVKAQENAAQLFSHMARFVAEGEAACWWLRDWVLSKDPLIFVYPEVPHDERLRVATDARWMAESELLRRDFAVDAGLMGRFDNGTAIELSQGWFTLSGESFEYESAPDHFLESLRKKIRTRARFTRADQVAALKARIDTILAYRKRWRRAAMPSAVCSVPQDALRRIAKTMQPPDVSGTP
jgi:hypothetical protein